MTTPPPGAAPVPSVAARRLRSARERIAAVPVGRLTGFLVLPLISAIAPFLVLPVLLRYVGTEAWAGIALGQSVGTGASVLVMLGWAVVGPTVVAEDRTRAADVYTTSLVSRGVVFAVAAPVAMALAGALAPAGARSDAVLMAFASSLLGLSASWFFVGLNRPRAIAAYDTVPKVVATAVAALLISRLTWAWLYPVALLTSYLGCLALVSLRYWDGRERRPLRTTLTVVRQQWAAVGVSAQAAVNVALPLTVVAAVAPPVVAGFAAADRLMRLVVFALLPVGSAFQGWVSEPSSNPAGRRRIAFLVTTGAGLAVALGYGAFADVLMRILFADKLPMPRAAVVCYAVAIVAVATSTTLGFHVLVPLRMTHWMAASTLVEIVLVGAVIAVLAPRDGVTGCAVAVMIAELGLTSTQVVALLLRRWRLGRRPGTGAGTGVTRPAG